MAAAQDERRNPFVWFAALVVVIVVVFLGGIAIRLLRLGEPSEDATATDIERPTASARAAPASPPTLAMEVALRASPAGDAREVARAFPGTPVRLAGRLEDGSWYAVEVAGRIDALGWVPAAALSSVDPAGVPIVTAPGAEGILTSAPTNDLPNLVLDALVVRNNKVSVVLLNDGPIDLDGPFNVTIGGGAPYRIDLPGKSLRPGDRIESPLEGEYVQRRASIVASVSTALHEETLDDNRIETTIGPDVPNDLEVNTATAAPTLAVTIRNNSPIPLVGTINVTVRETRQSTRLLTRLDDAPLKIEAGGTQIFRFATLTGLDLTRTLVLIDTTAINDAELANDIFPR